MNDMKIFDRLQDAIAECKDGGATWDDILSAVEMLLDVVRDEVAQEGE